VPLPRDHITELLENFRTILGSGRLTLGPYTEEFELAWSKWVGCRYSVAVNSGTSALEIILRSLNVVGKTVLVPTNTFFATPAAALHAGARVKFLDVGDHLMIDESALEQAIDSEVAAIMVVHIGGYVHPEMKRVAAVCKERGVPLVEDAAHAHGSRLGGNLAGTFGIASAFSFYPTKVMTTGEGGMISTDNERIAEMARTLRDQGKVRPNANFHTELSYNWRMSELSAALGISQLGRLAEFIEHRQQAAKTYSRGLTGTAGIVPMQAAKDSSPNYYKFVAFLENKRSREEVKRRLASEFQIFLSGEVYDTPCHQQPVFRRSDVSTRGFLTNAETLCKSHICIPVYSDITPAEQDYALDAVKKVLA